MRLSRDKLSDPPRPEHKTHFLKQRRNRRGPACGERRDVQEVSGYSCFRTHGHSAKGSTCEPVPHTGR